MSEIEYSVAGSPEAGSRLESAKDAYGMCVVCGYYTGHCPLCHRGHDWYWSKIPTPSEHMAMMRELRWPKHD